MKYAEFLRQKTIIVPPAGIDPPRKLNRHLMDFQRDVVKWALRKGRAAVFADCGLGKTIMQLEWARCLPGRVLILAPLAVAKQTVQEGEKFGIACVYGRKETDAQEKIVVTNYEMMEHFDTGNYEGIVLDESSILKSYDGKTRTRIIQAFERTPYRLACTATPAPNDYMELGNHAEFLGVMKRSEMLSMFFVHDGGETQKWRLKGHAEDGFWRWLCSWAIMMSKPSDLHYNDGGFVLPKIRYYEHSVAAPPPEGMLFSLPAQTLQDRIKARASSVEDRAIECAKLLDGSNDQWLVWCNRNDESSTLKRLLTDAVEVKGSDSLEYKEKALTAFAAGQLRILITKPTIAGFGMNFQSCNKMAFVGLSDSWEQWYQAVRRCWRFGQKRPVDVHVITANTEGAVVANIKRKEKDARHMAKNMLRHMAALNESALKVQESVTEHKVNSRCESGKTWEVHLGDCVDVLRAMGDSSIDYSVFSPPFASLYTYTNSERDMGNCRDDKEFFIHLDFLVAELSRVIRPGRLVSVHCMDLPTSKSHHGVIGLRDFPGELIRAFEKHQFIFHSKVTIWKDPVTAMQRTKALGLLHKQLKKDSTMSRMGIPDYVVTFRQPGENTARVAHTNETFPVSRWQQWASPIWTDINPSDTLQFRSAREHKDEKHIAPLQLEVIRRCLTLWTNPGDLVLSPFAGIGSEGYVSLQMGRRFIGIELKESYWKQAVANLRMARADAGELFREETTA